MPEGKGESGWKVNVGSCYVCAKHQAQENANRSRTPRYLHKWNGIWWIGVDPCTGAEEVMPKEKAKGHHARLSKK